MQADVRKTLAKRTLTGGGESDANDREEKSKGRRGGDERFGGGA